MNAPNATVAGPLDLGILATQTGGDRALERQVLEMFLSQLPRDIALLRRGSDTDGLEIAHRIAGSARAVGAVHLASAAAAIGAAGGLDGDAVGEVEAAFEVARQFVAAYLST